MSCPLCFVALGTVGMGGAATCYEGLVEVALVGRSDRISSSLGRGASLGQSWVLI